MATFKVVPDKRYKRKDNTNRYCLRAIVDGNVYYLPLKFSLSEKQHNSVFNSKSLSEEHIDFREKIQNLEIKAQRAYSSMRSFDLKRFKQLFYSKDKEIAPEGSVLPKSLALKELFQHYIDNVNIKRGTKGHMKVSLNKLEEFHHSVYVGDVNVDFLQKFELFQKEFGKSMATIASYMRDLRSVINYFRNVKKLIPVDYNYPFGRDGYSVKTHRKKKSVLSNEEILKVIELDKFDDDKQEYARNIWLTLYYGSGINPIDLLKLRWKDMENDHAHLIRTKTETTRKTNTQELTLPLTQEFRYYINKVCDPTSPFLIGKLKEGYTETSLANRKNRFRQEINVELKQIRKKLNLSAPLLMGTARDCYASTLKRNGVPREFIGDMLGHNDPRTLSHYLDSLSIDETFDVNNHLVKGKKKGNRKNDKDDDETQAEIT